MLSVPRLENELLVIFFSFFSFSCLRISRFLFLRHCVFSQCLSRFLRVGVRSDFCSFLMNRSTSFWKDSTVASYKLLGLWILAFR